MVGPGRFTAEAWEFERRDRLHGQLRLARRIRMDLEEACKEAGKGPAHRAKEIFISKINIMNELASLTQAVSGKYTLKNYNEYQVAEIEEEKTKLNSYSEALGCLREHRKLMAYEQNPSLREHDSALQAAESKRDVNESMGDSTERKRISRKAPPRVINTKEPSAHKRRRNDPIQKDENISLLEDERCARRTRRTAERNKKMMNRERENKAPPQRNTKKTSTRKKHEENLPPALTTKPTPKSKKVPSRKCHFCKNASTTFRQCHYFFITGDRCKKFFCTECLIKHFNFEESKNVRDEDWHCPACLGTCTCSVCVRKREKEKAWDEYRRGRRTSTRTKH